MKTQFDNNTEDKYSRARKRLEDLKGFYYHLIAYLLVIPYLIFINHKIYWEFKWFWFPMIGWGMGLAFHAYQVFINKGCLGEKWEQRKIEEFMREEEEEKRWM